MGHCNLCHEDVPDEELVRHTLVEHDIDIDAEVEKWPDGEWVVYDQTLEPKDFE